MYEIAPERFKVPPFQHQLVGVKFILSHIFCAILDEMGSGKTKQVIDACCILFEHSEIDTVVVVAPSAVKIGWRDLNFGEIVKHAWVRCWIGEYNGKTRKLLPYTSETRGRLYWIVTNYEFIRQPQRLQELKSQLKGRRVLVVADEGSFIKNYRAAQTKATVELRKSAKRAILLNGSPISNGMGDIYSQMEFLSPTILGAKNWWAFRNRWMKLGGYLNKQIIGYNDLPGLLRKVEPYALRRLKKDCLDLPPKLYKQLPVPLSEESWRIYREMRDQMVAMLTEMGPVALTMHAIVKILRLSQITSGFIGGVEGDEYGQIREIGNEKLTAFLGNVEARVEDDPNFRLVVWCRFRAERERAANLLRGVGPVFQVYGGQSERERVSAIEEFTTGTRRGPVFFVGNQQAGGFGLNLVTSSNSDYLSNDYNLLTRKQSEDRQHRPGQENRVLYTDYLATGPQGQKTIDHIVFKALQKKEEFATWTTNHWVKELLDEDPVF